MKKKNFPILHISSSPRSKIGAASVFVVALTGLGVPHAASADPAGCVIVGVLQTCTGDNSAGIVGRAPIETLTVEDLTRDIAPTAGVAGIDYQTETNAPLLSDTGSHSILTTDAAGITVTSDLGDVYISHTGDLKAVNGKGIVTTAGNGAAVVEGSGKITSDLDAVSIDPRGGAAAFNWKGDITSNEAAGLFVRSYNGGASADGSGDISAKENAVVVDTRGLERSASFKWDGKVSSETGNGVLVYAANGGASVEGTGDVSASGYGFWIETDHNFGDNASLTWTGDIFSKLSYGAKVLSATGGTTIKGSGNIVAKLDGLAAINTWSSGWAGTSKVEASSTINWTGDVTSTEGRAVTVTSAGGGVNLQGSGTLSGATDGVYIQTNEGQTAALGWSGDISGTTGFGAYVYSAHGPTSVTTSGTITAGNGGIYAVNNGTTEDSVSVNHTGNITAGGVGVEATSPGAPVSVEVHGDVNAGSYGIYTMSQGSSTVSVTLEGGITASGFDGIFAKSSTGIVAVNQNGAINSDANGIFAESEGSNTVSVIRRGDITAGRDGIHALSSLGIVSVSMSSGTIVAADTGIYARSTGENTVDVSLVGDVAQSTTAVSASSSTNGAVFVDVQGDLTSTKDTIIAENIGFGEVGVNHSGNITSTTGDGISASSASGVVTVYQNQGALVAAKDGLHLKGFNDLVAEVGTGASVTGGMGFAGVFMDTGYNNRLTNFGTIDNAAGVDGYAIKAEGNNTYVHNYGAIVGNVALGPYANSFNNYEGALLETGSLFKMVNTDTLVNDGTVSPGGNGQLQVTTLTGNLQTSSTSVLLFDLDMGSNTDQIDRIDVSGTADLSGKVKLNYLNFGNTPQSATFITTGGGVINQSLSLIQNAFVDATIETTNSSQDVQLTFNSLDFAPDGLTGNAQSVASYFQRAMMAGGAGLEDFSPIIMNTGYDASAQQIYEQISPEIALAPLNGDYDKAMSFGDALMSCSVPSGTNAPIAEGECDWFRISATSAERTSTVAPRKIKTSGVDLAFGIQRAIDMTDWRAVVAGSFTSGSSDGDAGQSAQSDTGQLGVALKYAPGSFVLSTGLTGLWSSGSTTRQLTLGDVSQTLVGTPSVSAYNLKLRAAYLMEQSSFYLKPQMDINVTLVHSGAYTESGGSGAIAFDNQSDTLLSLSPSIEIGRDFRDQSGRVTRAFARVGSTLYSKDGLGISGRLATDSIGTDMFELSAGRDKQVLDLALGMTSFSVGKWSAELGYKGRFSKNLEEHSANLKMRINF